MKNIRSPLIAAVLAGVAILTSSTAAAFTQSKTTRTTIFKDAQRNKRSVSSWSLTDAKPSSLVIMNESPQEDYGDSIELPRTYVTCGQCKSSYAMKEEDLGTGRGRRLECSVCGHSWYQGKDRLLKLNDSLEMVPLPEMDKTRIALNIEEGKSPKFIGDRKLYVGNLSYETTEENLYDVFKDVGVVGEVSLVRDNYGKKRGFGFVTMRDDDDGMKAIDALDGTEINGRSMTVRVATGN